MNHQQSRTRNRAAFSLVELLVVITIIVVLLALLAPAMDKAIYQAELAVCGSHLHAIANGVTTYAFNFKRYYPHRPGVVEPGVGWQPTMLYNGDDVIGQNAADTVYNAKKFDDRPLFRTFLALNAVLNDPLTGRIDLDAVTPQSDRVSVYQPYALWFGWQFRTNRPLQGGVKAQRGMRKIGDRLEWTEGSQTWLGDLLAQDTDATNLAAGGQTQSSHPARDGIARNIVLQEQMFSVGGVPAMVTASFWRVPTGQLRGVDDLNYAYADGSVIRFNDVKFRDERMAFIPEYNNDQAPGWRETVPPR